MSENQDIPTPRRSRAKSLTDAMFSMPNAIAGAVINELTPAQRAALKPAHVAQIMRTAIEAGEKFAATIAAAVAQENSNG
jgi:transposase